MRARLALSFVGILAVGAAAAPPPAAPPVWNLRPSDGATVGSRRVALSGSVSPEIVALSVAGREANFSGGFFSVSDLPLEEGSNAIEIAAKDRRGEVTKHIHRIMVDTVPPAVTIESPSQGTVTRRESLEVSGSVEDASPVRVAAQGKSGGVAAARFTLSGLSLQEGRNEVWVVAVDAAGNRGETLLDIERDSLPPKIALLDGLKEISEGEAFPHRFAPVVAVSDAHLSEQRALLNGSLFRAGARIEKDGAYEVTVEASDAAGNVSRRAIKFTVDTSAPRLSQVSPSDGAVLPLRRTAVSGDCGDAVEVRINGRPARVANGGFRLEGLELPEGRSTLEIVAKDRAGNLSRVSNTVSSEPDPPRLAIEWPKSGAALRESPIAVRLAVSGGAIASVTVNGIAAEASPEGGFVAREVPLAEGLVTLTAVARDRLGRVSTVSSRVFADRTPPRIEISDAGTAASIAPIALSPGAVLRRRARPVFRVRDSSPVTVSALLNGHTFASGSEVLEEGNYTLEIEATDRAGNLARRSVPFRVDARPPRLSVARPATGSATRQSSIALSGDCEDAVSVIVSGVAASVHGGRFVATGVALSPGENFLAIWAKDAAGNESRQTHGIARDNTPPVLAVARPSAGGPTRAASVAIEGTVRDEREASVQVAGVPAVLSGSRFRGEARLSEGANRIRVAARDAAGNLSEVHVDIVRDSTPPVLLITSPAEGTLTPAGRLDVEGEALDPNLSRVEIAGRAAEVSGRRFRVRGVPLSPGENTLTAAAFDSAGNSSRFSVRVIRDEEALDVRVSSVAPEADGSVSVSGTVSGGPGLKVAVNGVAAKLWDGAFEAPGVQLNEGGNTLLVRASGSDGRSGVAASLLTFDRLAPALTSVFPADGASSVAASGQLRLLFSEPLDPATVTQSNLRLERESAAGRETVPASLSLAGAGREVSLLPDSPLAENAAYRLTVSSSVSDLSGNRLEKSATSGFTTEPSEAPPLRLEPVPSTLCAASLTLRGTTSPGSRVRVSGEVSSSTAVAGPDGRFLLETSLAPDRMNLLEVAALEGEGQAARPLASAVRADCSGRAPEPSAVSGQLSAESSPPSASGQVLPAAPAAESAASLPPVPAPDGFSPTAEASAPPSLRKTALAADESGLYGEVFDDRTGRPLPGALVKVLTVGGSPPATPIEAVSDSEGKFWLISPPGEIVLEASRADYTSAIRIESPPVNETITVFDFRMTPLTGAAASADWSGQITDAGLRLTLPAGALPSGTAFRSASLSPQGLSVIPPLGWTAAAAIALDTGAASLALPASASWANRWGFPLGTTLLLGRYDPATRRYVNAGSAAFSLDGSRVEAAIPAAGSWAVFIADPAPNAPPTPGAGAPLSGVTPPASNPLVSAAVASEPAAVLPTQTAEITATLTLSAHVPSGYPVEVLVSETLTLLDSRQIQVPSFQEDLLVIRDGAGRSLVAFRVRPSATAAQVALSVGYENLIVKRYIPELRRGDLIGPAGGTVTGPGGFSLAVPANALTRTVPIRLLPLSSAADLPVPLPSGFEFLAAVSLSTGGETLASPATLSWASATDPTGNGMVWAQVAEINGILRVRFVAPARYVAASSRVETTPAAIHNLPVPGVARGGLYVLLRSQQVMAFAKGRVLDVGAAPLSDAVVWQDGTSITAFSTSSGEYALPVPAAGTTVRSLRVETGNGGSASVPVQSAGAVATVDISLAIAAPFVTSVSPAAASLLPLDLPVVFNLSEPLQAATVSNSSVAAAAGATPIPGTVRLSLSGTQVTFTPNGLWPANRPVRLTLSSSVTDLQGYRLVDATTRAVSDYSVTYTTVDPTPPSDINPLLIAVSPPGGSPPTVTISGSAGAACPGCTVIAVNDTTTVTSTTTALSDGSFTMTLAARLTDRISLTIRRPGGGEIRVNPGPFRENGGRVAYAGTAAADYLTADRVRVTFDAGTFAGPVTLRVNPIAQAALPVPVPSLGRFIAGIEFDPGGAVAGKPIDLAVPAPEGVTSGQFLVARAVTVSGQPRWMVIDTARYDNGAITTRPPPGGGGLSVALGALGGPLVPRSDSAAVAASGDAASGFGNIGALATQDLPSGDPKAALDRVTRKSNLLLLQTTTQLNFLAGIVVHPNAIVSFSFSSQYEFLRDFIPFVWVAREAKQQSYFAVPVPAGIPFTLNVQDASTGLTLFRGNFSGATDPNNLTVIPPAAITTNLPPARLTSASPLTAHTFVPAATRGTERRTLLPGIEYDFVVDAQGRGTVNLRGLPGAAGGCVTGRCVEVSLVNNVAAAVAVFATAAADGSFGPIAMPATLGEDLTFLSGTASLAANASLRLLFSQALAASDVRAALELRDSDASVGVIPFEVRPDTNPPDASRGFTILPSSPFQSGHEITLKLTASGRALAKTLQIKMHSPRSDLIGPRDVSDINALYLKGGLLLEAAATRLSLYDVSDPGTVRACPPSLTLAAEARGVKMDEHDRVLVALGGGGSNGRVQVFRLSPYTGTGVCGGLTLLGEGGSPGDLDRSWTEVTVRAGAGSLGVLPEGFPSQVEIFTRESREEITLDREAALPRFVTRLTKTDTSPADGKQDANGLLLIDGRMDGTPGDPPSPLNQPATVINHTTGASWTKYADASGNFSFAATDNVRASSGDRLEFRINATEAALVGTVGFGIQGVDVNKTVHLFGQDCIPGGSPNDICEAEKRLRFSLGNANPHLCKQRDGSGNCTDAMTTLERLNDIALLPAAPAGGPEEPAGRPLLLGVVNRFGLVTLSLSEEVRATQLGPGLPLATFDSPPVYPNFFAVAAARGFPVKPPPERTFCGANQWPAGVKPTLAFAGSSEGIFVVDVTKARVPTPPEIAAGATGGPVLLGIFKVSATAGQGANSLALDARRGLLYVGTQEAVAVYDMSDPCTLALPGRFAPANDRRLLARVPVSNQNVNVPFVLEADTGLLFGASDPTGGATQGKAFALSLFAPPVRFIADTDRNGGWEEVVQAIPLGVANPEKATPPSPPAPPVYRPDVVHAMAHLFGGVGRELVVEVSSASRSGVALPPMPEGFPRAKNYVTLFRQSDNPSDPGYNRYLSPPIVLIADPRARKRYSRLAAEEEATAPAELKDYACKNCRAASGYDLELAPLLTAPAPANDGAARSRPLLQAFEQWAGEKLVARLAEDAGAETALKGRASYLVAQDLQSVRGEAFVVRGDLTPALKQPPAQNASLWTSEAGVAVATNSGGAQTAWTDLAIKGRGLDFVFSRYYVSDVLHAGPFGRNLDSPLFARLRDLPSGDVDFYPGDGSRRTFRFDRARRIFSAPAGLLLDLYRLPDLTFLLEYPDKTRLSFDPQGRLIKLTDRQTTTADGTDGNAMEFFYDGAGRLVLVTDSTKRAVRLEYHSDTAPIGSRGLISKVTDFDDRVVEYSYDASGRLTRASGPDPGGTASRKPETTFAWSPASGVDLKQTLYRAGELLSATDGEARRVFEVAYEAGAPARVDTVRAAGQTWDFSFSDTTATLTDPNSNVRLYAHEAAGQAKDLTEPGAVTTAFRYDAEGRLTQLTRPLGGRVVYTYDARAGDSKLPMGNVRTVTEHPRPGSPEAGAGQTLLTQIEYGAANLPTRLTAPDGGVTTVARDANGNPTLVTMPDLTIRRFSFDDRGLLTSSTDGRNITENYTYFGASDGEKEGYLKTRTVAAVATTSYEVDDRGNLTRVSDPSARVVTYQVNLLDQVEEERRGASQVKSRFNAALQLLSRDVLAGTDAQSNPIFARTSYEIDEVGRLKTRTETGSSGSSVASYTYDLAGNLRTVSRTASPTVTFGYDSRDRVTSVTQGASITRYGYDLDSVRTGMTSPRNFATNYLVDGFGRNAGSTDPTQVTTREILDRAGRSLETRVTKPSGTNQVLYRWTVKEYDPAGRVKKEIRKLFENPITLNADGTIPTAGVSDVITETTYDAAGDVKTVKDPLNRVTTNDYEPDRGRLLKLTDAVGNTVEYLYDNSDNKTEEKVTELSPSGPPQVATSRFFYDVQNRLTKVTNALNQETLYEYDPRGNQTKVTDAETRVRTSEYDLLGRKIKETDPNVGVTQYEYDLAGRLTALLDAKSNRTEFRYDGEGRLIEEKRPDLKLWRFSYDAEGNRTSATDPNGTGVTTAYDPISRPTGRTVARGAGVLGPAGVTFTLDPQGRIVSSATAGDTAAVTEVFAYDSLDRLLREEQRIGSGANRIVAKAYDLAGNVTGLTYPSALALTQVVDPLNRIAEVKQGAASIVAYRDAGARPYDKTLANGIAQTFSYDPARRLTEILAKQAAVTVSETDYVLSPLGNKREIQRPDLGKKALYQFNPNSWITQESLGVPMAGGTPERQTDYTADKVLNYTEIAERENGTLVATKTQTLNNRNQYTAFAGAALTYDSNGNVTGGAGLAGISLQYDYENRLKKATKPDGTLVENLYDAQGRKVRESVTVAGNTRTTDYVLSGDQVVEEYAGTSLSARYVHGRGIDETVRAELDTNADGSLETTLFPIQDELGNVERLTDTSGATVERYDYQGYGKFRIFDGTGAPRSTSSYGWKWLFQGREYQTNLAAYDFRARTLWPELGRFGQEDPAFREDPASADSLNLFQAFLGNWPRFTDPTGLCADPGGPPGSVRICVDTFIRTFLVGGVLGKLAFGDNRSFEANGDGSYRSRVQLVIDPRKQGFARPPDVFSGISTTMLPAPVINESGSSYTWRFRKKGYGPIIPTLSKSGADTIVRVEHSAYNGFADPIVPGPPKDDISYTFEFKLRPNGEVEMTGAHDGYPSYEVWVYRDGERPTGLYLHEERSVGDLASPEEVRVPPRFALPKRR